MQPNGTTLEKSNHSCDPNCSAYVDAATGAFVLRAVRSISSGAPVTFDYETTEWAMDEPFACECGTPSCRGQISGFKKMAPEAQAKLQPRAAAHIQKMHLEGKH